MLALCMKFNNLMCFRIEPTYGSNPGGDPYPGLAYFISFYEQIRLGIFLGIIGYDRIEKYSSR